MFCLSYQLNIIQIRGSVCKGSSAAKGSNDRGHVLFQLSNEHKTNQKGNNQDLLFFEGSSAAKRLKWRSCFVLAINQIQKQLRKGGVIQMCSFFKCSFVEKVEQQVIFFVLAISWTQNNSERDKFRFVSFLRVRLLLKRSNNRGHVLF